MTKGETSLKIINITTWIEENKKSLLPPVCNKLLHNQQLVVMFVGGPNAREDYHIEEGEEMFYQLKGDICVKIIENNVRKDIVIKEGEFFVLPARIPHSPQRAANSIGLVIERRREPGEIDGVRWHIPNETNVLYEKWFFCKDLGIELVPLIKNYFSSKEHKTKTPGDNVMDESKLPYKLSSTNILKELHGAFNLEEKINSTDGNLVNLTPKQLNLQFEVAVLKKGSHIYTDSDSKSIDIWLFQLKGNSSVKVDTNVETNETYKLQEKDSVIVPVGFYSSINIDIIDDESFVLKVTQNPGLKN